MKVILAITVVCCFFAAASAQNLAECAQRTSDAAACVGRQGPVLVANNTDSDASFCGDCGNLLVSFYRDCASGVGVSDVQRGKKDNSACTNAR